MPGIISYAVSLPSLRLPASAYVENWGVCEARGLKQKAFCAYDEDPVTLGIQASKLALKRLGRKFPKIDALFFGVTTPPYEEKPSAATLPTALFDYNDIRVTEITGSPQAGIQALIAAIEYCEALPNRYSLAVAADAPVGKIDTHFEHALGAAGAAFVIGPGGGVANMINSLAITQESFGARFRRQGEERITDLELRTQGNLASVTAIGAKFSEIKGVGVGRIAIGAEPAVVRAVNRVFGLPEAEVISLWSQIGDAGSASAPFALAAAFDKMCAGDTVLAVGIGSGATAGLFKAEKGLVSNRRTGITADELIGCGRMVKYIEYLKHKRVFSI